MTANNQKSSAKKTTLLVLLVDRSGSMQAIKQDMEGGISALLAEQGEQEGTCVVTLAQFDTEYELVADGVPAAELEPYRLVPRGGTALLDAIGRTIAHVKDQVDRLGDPSGPDHVIVAVVTDGLENSSMEWSHLQVMDTVKARVAEGWDFTFLGANQDAIEEGSRLGVSSASSLTYGASQEGTRQAFAAMSSSVSRRRRGETKSLEYSEDERRRATGS